MNVFRLLVASAASCAVLTLGVLGCTDDPLPAAEPSVTAPAPGDAGPGPIVDAGPPSDPAVGPAIAAFAREFAQAACARATTCCGPEEEYASALGMFNEGRFNPDLPVGSATTPSRAACAAELQKRIESLTAHYAASTLQGRMAFDAARARKCVDDLRAAACGPEIVAAITTNACIDGRRSAVFQKIAKPGEVCADLHDGTLLGDCDPRLGFCARMVRGAGKDASVDTTGKCHAWPEHGEACGPDKDARYIVYCNTLQGADCSDIVGGTCTRNGRELALGAACELPSGTPFDTCPPGAYCGSAADGGTKTCLLQRQDGEPCSDLAECVTRLPFSCARPIDGGDFVCGQRRFCAK